MGLDVADDGPLLAGTAVVARFVIAHGGHDRALIDASGFQLARQAASHLGASIGGELAAGGQQMNSGGLLPKIGSLQAE